MKKKFYLLLVLFIALFATRVKAVAGGTAANPTILTEGTTYDFKFSDMHSLESSTTTDSYYYVTKITLDEPSFAAYMIDVPEITGGCIMATAFTNVDTVYDNLNPIKAAFGYFSESGGGMYDWAALKAGSYYIVVQLMVDKGYNTDVDFSMIYFTATTHNDELEPNNVIGDAQKIDINRMYDASFSLVDIRDYYTVNLKAGKKTRIYLNESDEIKGDNYLINIVLPDGTTPFATVSYTDLQYDRARCQYYYEFVPLLAGDYFMEVQSGGGTWEYKIGVYQSGTVNPGVIEDIDYFVSYYNDEYSTAVFRMYNPNSGEHLYTTDAHEAKIIYKEQGWGFEGIGWFSSNEGVPVYRLYNPRLGNHLYTTDLHEIEVITTTQGWVKDFDGAPVMYSTGDTSDIPVYRLYNQPLNGMHHLTTDENEYNVLPDYGWAQEGISMYVYDFGDPSATDYYYVNF